LEGMACETPSILGRLPRYEEIVSHRESAYFVDADPASIGAGILELLGQPHLRAHIARTALAIVREQGSLGEQAALVERRFQELADVPPRVWSVRRLWQASLAYCRFALGARA